MLDRFSPVEMGPKWTGRSGELRRGQGCALRRLSIGAGWFCRLGTVSLPGWRALQAGPAGASAPPWRREAPRVFFGGGAANGARPEPTLRIAASVLCGVSVGSATKPTCSGRGRLRPARRERSADRGPQGTGLPPSGGWRQRKSFGHDGFGRAQHRRDQRARVEVALAGGTHDAGQHLPGVGPAPGAVAAADLTRDYCGADGLFGPPVGGVDRRVAQEEEHRREFVGQVLGEALGVGQRRRGVDQPAEPGGEPTAGRRQTVFTDFARVERVRRARPSRRTACTAPAQGLSG